MSVSINMTITNVGFQAIFNANNTGVELNLTHLQLGSGQRTTDKSETTLVSPIQFQAITAAERPSLNQVRMSAVFPITQTYDICEIGIWAGEPGTSGSVLFAYWASPDGKLVTTAPGVDFVFTHDMTMDQSVADSINVVIDPNASSFLSLLNLHLNDAGDPHSQYLKKTDFDNAVIDLQNTVSNNTSGSFTSHTNASDPHPQYTTDTEAGTIAASAITAHTSEVNPHTQYALTSHTHSNATETEDGLMSANDKTKLNGISTGATAYTHPTGDGNLHVPATGTTNAGKVLTAGATAGSLLWSAVDSTPPGQIGWFARNTPPTGWLEANGQAIDRSNFKNLFDAIGTTFGAGDGVTTFNIPDLRGEFVRGWDNGRGVDNNRNFGSNQNDDLKSHNHQIFVDFNGENAYGQTTSLNVGGASITGAKRGGTYSYVNGESTQLVSLTGGNETRPRNVAMLVCIKY